MESGAGGILLCFQLEQGQQVVRLAESQDVKMKERLTKAFDTTLGACDDSDSSLLQHLDAFPGMGMAAVVRSGSDAKPHAGSNVPMITTFSFPAPMLNQDKPRTTDLLEIGCYLQR